MAEVGTCKVSDRRYNQNLECETSGIGVGPAQDEPDCPMFERR